ncbi:MAG: sodium:solute symporter [candidate division KSB1 bacterium]|jgi:SSS family solute:Na+ symporter|nr:sodium:solute symporter [candidate division KSB1 bacterium]
MNLAQLDMAFVGTYFVVLLVLACYFSRREKTSTDYFLAGRGTGWVVIGASLFASNISSEHFVSLAGSGASRGLAIGHFEWQACLVLLALGWVFVPLYLNSGVSTTPEFLEKRYGRASRIYLSSVSIVAYVLTRMSVILFAGSLLLRQMVGWNMATSAVVMACVAGIYSVAGGLKAIVHLDVFQSAVLLAGAALLTMFGLREVGGWHGLQHRVPQEFFHMMKPPSDPDFPWTGILLGAPILSIWYWCTDQYTVQRVLSGRNIDQARSGAVLAGFLKILSVFVLVLPGLVAHALSGDSGLGARAYPVLATCTLLPPGVKGVVVVSLMAALISSLASCFNSSSALFTLDFYRQFRPQVTEKELVLVGRLATTALVILAILWVPFMRYISLQIFAFLQSVQAYVGPPIAAVFVVGILWPGVNAKGAICSLCGGAVAGALRLVLELLHKAGHLRCAPLEQVAKIHFLHFAALLFALSAIVLVGVSLSTGQRPAHLSSGLMSVPAGVLASQHAGAGNNCNHTRHRANIAFSVLLVITVLFLYSRFL